MIDRMRTGLVVGMLASVGLASTPALAVGDLSDALDFVPAEAALVISTHNLKQTHSRMSAWAKVLEIQDAQEGLGMAQMFLGNKGIDAEGPAVVIIPEIDEDRPEPEPIILLPIKDFEDFVFGLGGEAAEGVTMIEAPFGTVFAMPLGDDFAAIAQDADLLDFIHPQGGNIDDHMGVVGKTGIDMSHASDLMMAFNVQTLAPIIEEGVAGMDDKMAMAEMGGVPAEQLDAMTAMMEHLSELFIHDGRGGMMGVNLDPAGISLDFGANFDAESETAAYFQNEGDSSAMMSQLPSTPFLFAMAMDYSGEGINTLIAEVGEMAKDMGGGGMGGINFMKLLGESKGQAQLIGVTPGLFSGGLFANTISYTEASTSAQELGDTLRGLYADLDGESKGGIEFETTYEQATHTVNGIDLDSWSIDMNVDPNDPDSMAAQDVLQAQTMLMGGGGPQGYIARAKDGIYQTMSRNSELMGKALEAAEGHSLAERAGISAVSEFLPANRLAEGYLDVGEVVNLVGSFAGMMGMEIPSIEDEMNPVGFGLTGDNSGVRFKMFVPKEVITTITEAVEDMRNNQEIENEEGDEPRF